MSKQDILRAINFGQRVAEDESDLLSTYFVETDHWRQLFAGDVDVVYGPKGSGKSALYSLLLARKDELFDRSVVLAPAENPRGAPAFRDLVDDPPTTEREFIALWKLYFATILSKHFDEIGIGGIAAGRLKELLQKEGLVQAQANLKNILHAAFSYVRRWFREPSSLEGKVTVDPVTQVPTGFSGKILFVEPSPAARKEGAISVDELLQLANEALAANDAIDVWILLDRLDVAFVDSVDLEVNALRALFRVYLDLLGFKHLKLKIFMRTDIWNRITASGFREASHVTRHITIDWNPKSLLNLIVRRAIQNVEIQRFYRVTAEEVLVSDEAQRDFFNRMCPDQVEVGPNKPITIDWMLSRTRDGGKKNAPRELIHLLNSLRSVEVRRLEIGEAEPEGEILFSRVAFKDALPEVSRVRLEQTLYAEYPSLKDGLEKLRGAKTKHTVETLASIWEVTASDAKAKAQQLVEVGFFELRGTNDSPEYWVPFLYREALEMIQGAAE